MRNGSEKVSAAIPSQLRAELIATARADDRSVSAELRRALSAYLGRSEKSRLKDAA